MTTTWMAWPPSCQTIVDIQELMCLCVYSGNEDSVFKFVMRWWESWMRGWIGITGKQAHHQYNHKNTVHYTCSHTQCTITTSYIDRSCGTFMTLVRLYTCIESAILIKVAFEFKPGSTQSIFAYIMWMLYTPLPPFGYSHDTAVKSGRRTYPDFDPVATP